ncbi:hypothetical protein KR215_005581 [Drosophila sulfurigaster]|nr:hypothetical protein KR215_005581 [Drosophila sulfurigaster]
MEQLLSTEECRLIAQRTLQLKEDDDNFLLLDWQLNPGDKDLMGYMGEYYKLHLQVQQVEDQKLKTQQELHYFVKSLPYNNPPQRAECERKGVFRKETTIYKDILPNVQRYASRKLYPKCYYSRDDVMVLEDLTQNFRHLKPTESYTLDHYKLVLEHLAALHAASIAWEEQEKFNIGERYQNVLIEMLLSDENEWFQTGLKAIVYLALQHKSFQDITSQQFIKNNVYQLLLQAADQLTKPSKKLRNVFSHRDLSRSNIFLNSNQGCLFIDFGLCSYSTPAIDIHFMLYINSSIEERRLMYDEIMEYYFDELQARFKLMDIPSEEVTREDFELDCRRGHLVGLIVSALCLPVFKIPAGLCTKLKFENSSKFDYWMNVDRSELLELAMAQDAAYKTEVMSIIAELVEYLMQNAKLIKDLIV